MSFGVTDFCQVFIYV